MTAQVSKTSFKSWRLLSMVAAGLMVGVSAAQADQGGFGHDRSGPYASLYAGAALGNELEVESGSATFDTDLDDDFVVGGTLGIRHDLRSYSGALRGEVDVNYQPVDGGSGDDGDLYGVLANAWYDIDTGGPMTPYLGGGFGLGVVDLPNADSETGYAYQVGGGLNFDLTPSGDTFVGVGYRYYGFDADVEDLDVDLTGHRVLATVGVNF